MAQVRGNSYRLGHCTLSRGLADSRSSTLRHSMTRYVVALLVTASRQLYRRGPRRIVTNYVFVLDKHRIGFLAQHRHPSVYSVDVLPVSISNPSPIRTSTAMLSNTLTRDMGLKVGPLMLGTFIKHYFDRVKASEKDSDKLLKQDEILYHETFNVIKVSPFLHVQNPVIQGLTKRRSLSFTSQRCKRSSLSRSIVVAYGPEHAVATLLRNFKVEQSLFVSCPPFVLMPVVNRIL